MKKLWLLLIAIFLLTGCGREKGQLILVTEAGFAPYEYYSNGEIVGVDIDIAKEIAKELNKELIIKDVAFDSIINEVKTGKSDIGAAGISYTEEREKEVDFTVSYAESRQVVIINKDGYDITDVNDLAFKKVAVQLGSIADDYLSNNYYTTNIVREKKFLAAIQDLKDHKVDAVVMDELPATRLITSDMKILDEPLLIDSYGMVIKKGNKELLEQVNNVIIKLKETGRIDEYMLKHLGVDEIKEGNRNIIERFYDSVIYDGRYKFILEGLRNTLLIALGAVLIGIVLGLISAIANNAYLSTGKHRLLNMISRGYVGAIRGTPSTLQLMIIYYVIFKQTNINIVLVGIIAFGINSGAYVAEIIRAGLNSIDKGQWEAGYALGLSYSQVVRKIILPQSIKNILPALGNEFITLIKETSIGAYIGIVELTKASDIIASRTYDYFFPLILIAIIYLIITLFLSKIIKIMEVRLNNARN